MATKRQLGGNLGHVKTILKPTRGHYLIVLMEPGGMREALLSSAGWQLGDSALPFGPESDTAGSLKACRRIQARRAGPRRQPNGDILHAL